MADDFLYSEERFLLVGKIAKPHGIRGEVKIYSYSEQPENLLLYRHLTLVTREGRCSESIKVKKSRTQGKFCVVTLEGIDSRNKADKIQGMGVLINKEDIPAPGQKEYYWYQLQGLTVTARNGKQLGVIQNLFSNGAHDILVIRGEAEELMIPMVDTIVLEQTEEGIVIDPPPGLLEMNAENDM